MDRWLGTQRIRDIASIIVVVLGFGSIVGGIALHKPQSNDSAQAVAAQPAPAVKTVWDQIMAQVKSDGMASRDMALQAFAYAYGELPGVTPPSGPDGPPQSTSLEASWILQYFDTLSAEQQKIVTSKLRLSPASTVRSGPKLVSSSIPGFDITKCNDIGDSVPNKVAPAEFSTPFPGQIANIEKLIGVTLDAAEYRVCVADLPNKNRLAETMSNFGIDGKLRCRTTIFPSGQQATGAERLGIITHEIQHCMNARLAAARKSFSGFVEIPGWIAEGICNWVAYTIAGPSKVLSDWAGRYGEDSRVPLIQRTYDAMMFWQHINNVSGDMAQLVQRVVGAAGDNYSMAAFKAATENDPYKILNSHPSSWLRLTRGMQMAQTTPWDMYAPGLGQRGTYLPHHDIVADAEPATIDTAAWGSAIAGINPQADVLMIRLDRGNADLLYGRYSPAPNMDYDLGLASSIRFCAKQGGCKCPDGSVDPNLDFTDISRNTGYLAVFGGPGDAGVSVVGYSMDSFCKKKPKPCHKIPGPFRTCDDAPLPGGGVIVGGGRRASTGGEPHQRTFDGHDYDMQAVGEFTLVKSTVDDFQVQTRTTPVPKTTTASMNTAVVMNVVGDKVAIYTSPQSATLKVNGSVVTPSESGQIDLPKGGKLQAFGGGISGRPSYQVDWPDGTNVGVDTYVPWGLGVQIGLPESRYGKVVGQLGDADGIRENDFKTRDGRALATNMNWNDFYKVFVHSWRLSSSESMFDYGAGETTDTFTDRTYPKVEVDPKSLPGRAEAEAICRAGGVTDPVMLENCIFDVVMTGDKVFAEINADLQKFFAGAQMLKDGDSATGATREALGEMDKHALDVGDAKVFFLADWSGLDPCKANVGIEGAMSYKRNCENKVLEFSLADKPSGPLALTVSNFGVVGNYKFTFITGKIREFSLRPGDKVKRSIDIRGRVDVYYMDSKDIVSITNRPEKCNSIFAEHTDTNNGIVPGVFGYVVDQVPLCGNPRTLLAANNNSAQRWVIVVRSRDVSTGDYSFNFS